MSAQRTALIIGASRGLGLALSQELVKRHWTVIATVRGRGRTALHEAADASGGALTVEQLEMTDTHAVAALGERLGARRLDLLFVNAGVSLGAEDRADTVSTEEFDRVLLTNALSPMRIIATLAPLVTAEGLMAAMSSSLGSVALNESGGWEVYRASKAALNTLMRSYAAREPRRTLALIDPGWVRTDMGGASASLGIEDSIPGVATALEERLGKPGLTYVDYRGKTVPW